MDDKHRHDELPRASDTVESGVAEATRAKIDAATSVALETIDHVAAASRTIGARVSGLAVDAARVAGQRASDLYDHTDELVTRGRQRYPDAERVVRAGRETMRSQIHATPFAALVVAGAVGYAVAWLIHGRR